MALIVRGSLIWKKWFWSMMIILGWVTIFFVGIDTFYTHYYIFCKTNNWAAFSSLKTFISGFGSHLSCFWWKGFRAVNAKIVDFCSVYLQICELWTFLTFHLKCTMYKLILLVLITLSNIYSNLKCINVEHKSFLSLNFL